MNSSIESGGLKELEFGGTSPCISGKGILPVLSLKLSSNINVLLGWVTTLFFFLLIQFNCLNVHVLQGLNPYI